MNRHPLPPRDYSTDTNQSYTRGFPVKGRSNGARKGASSRLGNNFAKLIAEGLIVDRSKSTKRKRTLTRVSL